MAPDRPTNKFRILTIKYKSIHHFASSYFTNFFSKHHLNCLFCSFQDLLVSGSLIGSSYAHLHKFSRAFPILWNFTTISRSISFSAFRRSLKLISLAKPIVSPPVPLLSPLVHPSQLLLFVSLTLPLRLQDLMSWALQTLLD